MDPKIIYAKTPTGDEAVRQSTRVVQRNLRMVLVQVDGKMTAGEMAAKIGNPRLVEAALRELEEGGFIAPTVEAVTAWEEGHKAAQMQAERNGPPPMSEFSTFAPKPGTYPQDSPESALSQFSTFDSPAYPPPDFEQMKRATLIREPEKRTLNLPKLPSVSFKMLFVGTLLIAVVTIAGIIMFYPLEGFRSPIESVIAKSVRAPVHIGDLSIAVSPKPHLKLGHVRVGDPADSEFREIRIFSPWSLLGSSPKLNRVDIVGANVATGRLLMMPLSKGEPFSSIPIDGVLRIEDFRARLNEEVDSPSLNGEISFRPDGAVNKASFESPDRTLLISASGSSQGISLVIEGRGWEPGGGALALSSLQANALLSPSRLVVQNIDTTFLGGILRGNWTLDWQYGLNMGGEFSLIRIDARKIGPALAPHLKMDGEINGLVRLRSSARDWHTLWQQADANVSLEMLRGTLFGLDLGEAARRAGGEVRSGSTRFDRLRTMMSISPRQISLQDIRMDAGMMTAAGQVSATRDGMIDGAMSVTMQTSVSSTTVPVRVQGRLPDLTANGRK